MPFVIVGPPPADLGTTAHIIAFPTDRVRASLALTDPAVWSRCFVAVEVADRFRDMWPNQAVAVIADQIRDCGSGTVARMLHENTSAIAVLRAILASLVEADRRIAAATDLALYQEGR